jgi:hypothetical protein
VAVLTGDVVDELLGYPVSIPERRTAANWRAAGEARRAAYVTASRFTYLVRRGPDWRSVAGRARNRDEPFLVRRLRGKAVNADACGEGLQQSQRHRVCIEVDDRSLGRQLFGVFCSHDGHPSLVRLPSTT